MTIGELKDSFRDLPDNTEVFITDPSGEALHYRTLAAFEIERTFEDGSIKDSFNIRLEED